MPVNVFPTYTFNNKTSSFMISNNKFKFSTSIPQSFSTSPQLCMIILSMGSQSILDVNLIFANTPNNLTISESLGSIYEEPITDFNVQLNSQNKQISITISGSFNSSLTTSNYVGEFNGSVLFF